MELVDQKMEYCKSSDDDGVDCSNKNYNNIRVDDDDDDDKKHEHGEAEDVPLPGFRFHPTDEELVGFYLRRKVEKRPISIELIKQIDIYKYDPWDLPKGSNVGDKEWYFFCKRGRKYRNSIRPNRVTGSGFWKATGIDRPIYATTAADHHRDDCIIGLKKSLVYYRGSAGKGTKTDWMMHEFRLPPPSPAHHHHNKSNLNNKLLLLQHNTINHDDHNKPNAQEAEVWTLCRILKRNVSSYKKSCIPDWREVSASATKRKINMSNPVLSAGDASSSGDSSDHNYTDHLKQGFNISFQNPTVLGRQNDDYKNKTTFGHHEHQFHRQHGIGLNGTAIPSNQQQLVIGRGDHQSSVSADAPSTAAAASYSASYPNQEMNEFSKHGDWDDLRSVVEFAATDPIYFMH